MLPSKPCSAYLTRFRRPLLLAAILIGFACSGGDEGDFWSLFQPETAATRPGDEAYRFTPLLYNTGMFGFDEGTLDDSLSMVANVGAWATYLGDRYSRKQIADMLADTARYSPFRAEVIGNHKPDAADYLSFAFGAQAATGAAGLEPWESPTVDTLALRQLAEKAPLEAKNTADPFLKERYAYQAVKLAAEAGQYAQSRQAYEQLVLPLPNKTFISDWARSRYAGALLRLGETDRAVFEFAQVFANCPSRRHAAERSLRMRNLRFTNAALGFAKTDAERVAVYALCAIQPKQDALPLLEKMVELDPKNPLNELVLAREINRNEYYTKQTHWLGYVENDETRTDSVNFENRRTTVADYNQQLLDFTKRAAQNAALGNPAFYLTAAAYLHYLAGDFANAKTTLDEAQAAAQNTNNRALKQQMALQQMLLLSAQPGPPDAPTETQFVTYLAQFKQNAETRYEDGSIYNTRFDYAVAEAGRQMANRYLGSADEAKSGGWLSGCSQKKPAEVVAGPAVAKAFLMRVIGAQAQAHAYGVSDAQLTLEDSTSPPTVQAVVDLVTKPGGETDERLAKLAGFDTETAYTLLGRRHMAVGNYEAAAQAFGKVGANVWNSEAIANNFTVDPFTINLPSEGKPDATETPFAFVQRMAALQNKARQATEANQTGDDVARLFYELGCGAYNLSYWGNAWILNRRYRSSAEPSFYTFSGGQQRDEAMQRTLQDPYYTNRIAQQYFEKAAQFAKTPEMAAKATYLAARCQHDALRVRREVERERTGTYVSDDDAAFNQKMADIERREYGTQADAFRQRYAQTRFAQDMQTHCQTYRDVVH